jgi:hypothetical protein
MKWTPCLVLAQLALVGCQQAAPPAQAGDQSDQSDQSDKNHSSTVISLPKAQLTDAYRADISTLCDVVRLSDANNAPRDERWTVIAMWLGPHIKTSEGHDFLVAIQPLQGEVKALALETEAKRVGLTSCPLAVEWRQPAGSAEPH